MGKREPEGKRTLDLVTFNALTGKVTDVRMFEEYPGSRQLIDVTPGTPEQGWTYDIWGRSEDTDPDKIRLRNHDRSSFRRIEGGKGKLRKPKDRRLRVIKGGLK